MAIYPVVMAGGSGTRFWPLSRRNRPKQLLALSGDEPLIVQAAKRVLPLTSFAKTYVVCGKAHAKSIAKLLPKLPKANLLVEPAARNTAPCIGLAAAVVAKKDPRGVLLVLPSDHHIADPEGFRAALATAAKAAESGRLMTIGVKPRHPETGFGYLQQGSAVKGERGVYEVRRFVEKPNLETAQRYLASGDYLWNAGIFVLRADRILEEIKKHLPEAVLPLEKIQAAIGKKNFAQVLAREFPKMPSVSIDVGVMEKAANIAMVPADFGWSDVGSFPALPGVRELDAKGNVVDGQALLVDVQDSVILAGERPLAVVGLKDVVVVDAGDALLVCPKERAQDVRKVVDELARRKLDRFL